MAHYLEGKTTVDTNELSPKEATQMSYDVKYIGMDVHKEAIVIAVLNGTGKMIMWKPFSKLKPAASPLSVCVRTAAPAQGSLSKNR
jgi:hypothetical protein